MLLRNYKDKMLIETVKKMTKFFKEYIENCNTIECSLEKIKDIIKIKEEQKNRRTKTEIPAPPDQRRT